MTEKSQEIPDRSLFWVVGGRYTDTTFSKIEGGGSEEMIGPFDSFEDARKEWQRKSWAQVDQCNVRYRIVEVVEN
jgi:hypothetical protein